jgi:prepilin-type N-terminal cleavage/methylation domain-containing protein
MKGIYKGFTLIEITLVIVLIAILIAITTPLVSNIVIRSDLSSAHESLYNALLRAQQLSKTQYKDSQWRVCIDNVTKTYTITAGICSSTQYPEIISINSGITISSDQTLDISFKPISGELDSINDLIKIDLTGGGVSKSVLINKSGVIDKEASTETLSNTPTPSIVTDGLVLNLDAGNINSYPGLNTAQNTWFDLSGSNNHGTLVNGVGFNGANGGALVFDGLDDYVSIGHITTLNPGIGDFTFGSFFKVNSGVTSNFFPVIFSKSQLDWQNGYLIRPTWPYNGTFIVGVSQGGSTGVDRTTVTSTLTASLGTWVNIVGVWTSSTRTLLLYFNGIQNGSSTITNSININPTANLEFGRYNRITQSRYEYLPGNIAQVSIYNRALTPEEIQQNFNATKGRFGL